VRFRRQEPIGPYIVDFVCHRANLVIEVDGGVHDQTDVAIKDLQRDTWLATQGYEVVRFSNKAVSEDIEAVVSNIRRIVSNRLGKVI
jgi:very-short-patch-repair endonuclease